MIYLIVIVLLLLVGFVSGIAVGRNNTSKVDSTIDEANSIKAKGKALLDALKGK